MSEKLFSLGTRLEICAGFVREGKVVADIGTDHAYLPIWLVATGKIPRAYASDINEEPIKVAKSNIDKHNLNDAIIPLIGNGLENIPQDDVDDIVIAGMGGDNIVSILETAKWLRNSRYRLILQPMSKIEKLRAYLFMNNFNIIKEKAVCEANRFYTVMCVEHNGKPIRYDEPISFTTLDFYIGGLSNNDEASIKLLKRQAGVLTSEANGFIHSEKPEIGKNLQKLADEILKYIDSGVDCNGNNSGNI